MRPLKILPAIAVLLIGGGIYYHTALRPQPYALGSTFVTKEDSFTLNGQKVKGGITTESRALTFELNGKPYTIPSGKSFIPLDIGAGSYTVTRDGKELGKIEIGWFDGKSIINLDQVPFVEVQVVYAANEAKYKAKYESLSKNTITVEGKQYKGPFRYIEPTLYLKQTWDYSPIEPSPDEIKIKGSTAVRTELMRTHAFIRSEYVDDASN